VITQPLLNVLHNTYQIIMTENYMIVVNIYTAGADQHGLDGLFLSNALFLTN